MGSIGRRCVTVAALALVGTLAAAAGTAEATDATYGGVAVTKITASVTRVAPGGLVTVTVTTRNTGSSAATDMWTLGRVTHGGQVETANCGTGSDCGCDTGLPDTSCEGPARIPPGGVLVSRFRVRAARSGKVVFRAGVIAELIDDNPFNQSRQLAVRIG